MTEKISCLYCGNPNHCDLQRGPKIGLLRRLVCEQTWSNTSDLYVNCSGCLREYYLTQIGDVNFWTKNLICSDDILENIKRKFKDVLVSFEELIKSLIGVVRDRKKGGYIYVF